MGQDHQGTERVTPRTTLDGWRRTGDSLPEFDDLTWMLDVLAHPYRRAVIAVLRDGEWLSIDVLTRAVLARCDAATAGDDRPPLETIRLQLHHTHLPKLDAADVITYDAADRRAVCTVEDDRFRRLLDDALFVDR
ncbi:DUF7344 domain-containing protein [Halorientalis pallida]|uniref:DUF7344 domain-containing protein n=1 Tax=Halorientalis pallida TaxID=2479928 RepID=A0A498KZR4_9EURY|nr:hypothetical protein [Halorientalis pallida]RXK46431.1 hypothetical protein EAF64_19265 [Halorientalis pallida]